jgi:uncharacterized integral membrane protein
MSDRAPDSRRAGSDDVQQPVGPAAPPRERSWLPRLIISGLALVLAVIFVLQNSQRVQATFLFWDRHPRLWVVILVSLVLGALLGQVLPALIRRSRDKGAGRRAV